jgi:hypothetical protein
MSLDSCCEHHGCDTLMDHTLLVTLGKSLYFDCFVAWMKCKIDIPCTCQCVAVQAKDPAQGVNVWPAVDCPFSKRAKICKNAHYVERTQRKKEEMMTFLAVIKERYEIVNCCFMKHSSTKLFTFTVSSDLCIDWSHFHHTFLKLCGINVLNALFD